jgi:thiamine biosynthesis lipoprotein
MYTQFEFTLYARPGDTSTASIQEIANEAFAAVDSLEAQISEWRRDSQTSYINQHAAQEPVRVATDLLDLLLTARTVHRDSHGAFDITVGPLIENWGFYRNQGRVPSDEELTKTLAVVGMDKVVLNDKERTVRFTVPGTRLDLGGIAKGLALDRAADVCRQYGVTIALLDAGTSSVLVLGAPPHHERGWTVRVGDPYNKDRYIEEIELRDASLSTSGSFAKFFELGGKKYCHIFDPRTGKPVEGILSASAIAPSGMISDALSTAFFVLGEEGTREYCRTHPDVRAVIVPIPESGSPQGRRINFGA